MTLIFFLFVLTIGLTLFLKFKVARAYGPDVAGRFLERLNYIPSQDPALLSRSTFATWLGDPTLAVARKGYAIPVLFPFDLLFLLSLGALLGFSSVYIVTGLPFLSGVPLWIWWVLPTAYAIADFAEDAFAAALLKLVLPLTDQNYDLMRRLTKLKFATVSLATGQVGFLTVLLALVYLFPANRPV